MHHLNSLFWVRTKDRYPEFFLETSVIEFGSMNINGSVRGYFDDPLQYIGVDWRAGNGVDLVSFAHEVDLHEFDVVISASMLEHDPHWDKSLPNMIKHLKEDGIMLLSWGSALNSEHEHEAACDGKFHPLPAGKVIKLLEEHGLTIQEFLYEAQLGTSELPSQGHGEVCLMAFKNPALGKGEPEVARLKKVDRT